MAFNGSGTYNLYTPGNPVVTGTTISSTWANNTLSDIATGLSTCITKDGQTTPTANIPMATFKITGLGAGTALTDAAQLAQVQNSTVAYLTSVSGADTITATANPVPSAYAAGQTFRFVAAGANTGAVTLNVSSLGAKAITKNGTNALVAGDIPASGVVTVTYDGTQFQLVNNALVPTFYNTLTVVSTDAGAAFAPTLDTYRNSASPVATDLIGEVAFNGNDDGGNKTLYADIVGRIEDPTNASEDGRLIFRTAVAGVITNQFNLTTGAWAATATGGAQGTGTINMTAVYDDGVQIFPSTANAAVATETGTGVTLSSAIPTWVKKITLTFVGVSLSGTNVPLVQIGPTSGVVGTGYLGAGSRIPTASNPVTANQTAGFAISGDSAAAAFYHGVGTLVLQNAATNTWAWSFVGGRSDTTSTCTAGGSISLSGALEDVVLTSVGGTDTFDAGSVGLMYE